MFFNTCGLIGRAHRPARGRLSPEVQGLEKRLLLARSAVRIGNNAQAAIGRTGASQDGTTVDATSQRQPRGPVWRNLSYESSAGVTRRLDIYLPPGEAPKGGWPVVVAIHGGGWRRFSKDQYGPRAAVLTQFGFAVVAPNYQLSTPRRPSWPQNLADLQSALEWMNRNGARYNLDVRRVATMGESAGGHLALMLGLESARTYRSSGIRISAIVNFYGPTDLLALMRDSAGAAPAVSGLLGPARLRDQRLYDRASPAKLITSQAPAVLTFHGLSDRLVPASQALRLDAALSAQGVDHETRLIAGADHGFGFRAGGENLLQATVAFLKSRLGEPS